MTDSHRPDWIVAVQRTCMAVATAAMLTALVACSAATGAETPADTDKPADETKPSPTLMGTWRGTDDWWQFNERNDEWEVAGTVAVTLTFTESRWISIGNAVSFDGMDTGTWAASGTWNASESTVTRIWDDDHDGNEATPRVEMSVTGDYYLVGDEGEVLFTTFFADEGDSTGEFRRYERVAFALPPASLVGAWTNTQTDDDGTIEYKTITIDLDGEFQYREVGTRVDGESWEIVINAKWELDPENYFLNLIGPTDAEGEPEMVERVAFAPTDESPAELAVSPHWNETTTSDHYHKYGNYYLRFTRETARP